MLMSLGPVELLFLACFIACFVSCSEIVTCVFCSFFIFLSMTLLLCVVEYFVVLVNCLLKCWAFSAFMVVWNLLNLLELLWACVGFSLFSAAIVFQNLCVLLQWAQLSVRCSFQSCCLSSCIILFILLFSGASCGSVGVLFPDRVSCVYGCSYVFWKEFLFVCLFCHGVCCACRQKYSIC